jgi:hypothetical protein
MPDLAGTARLLGRLRYLERRGFEVLGAWASTPLAAAAPEAAALAGAQAHHHADRADRLAAVMPSTPGLTPDELTVAGSPALAAFAALLAGAAVGGPPAGGGDGPPVGGVPGPAAEALDAAAFLAGHERVLLARLAVAYDDLAAVVHPLATAPLARALRLVAADLDADRRAGEAVVQRLLVDAGAVDRAAARVAELERALVGAGGLGEPPG